MLTTAFQYDCVYGGTTHKLLSVLICFVMLALRGVSKACSSYTMRRHNAEQNKVMQGGWYVALVKTHAQQRASPLYTCLTHSSGHGSSSSASICKPFVKFTHHVPAHGKIFRLSSIYTVMKWETAKAALSHSGSLSYRDCW